MKVLVVDDEPAVVAGIQALLACHGIEAACAGDRASAEEQIAAEFFHVILADLRMQSQDDGLHLIQTARRISPRSRVAAMTAHANESTEGMLRERGAAVVLRKPFLEEELLDALRSMLGAIEESETAHVDDDALYAATVGTLQAIARGRFGFPSEDAEELIQETWLLFLEKRRHVRTPKAWLTGTIANLCRQSIQRLYTERARAGENPDRGVVEPLDDMLAVRDALVKLDARSRSLCTMIGIEGRSYEEVSAAAGIPLGSVGPLYIRAKARLRKMI